MSAMTRRAMLAGGTGVCAAALLGACGGDSDGASDDGGADPQADAGGSGPGSGPAAGGVVLGSTSEVPVGSGKVFRDQKVVVTQPSAGQFKGFSAVCPHAGQLVGAPSGGTITCAFHGSKFSATDGSLQGGPATKGLTAKPVQVEGDKIVLG